MGENVKNKDADTSKPESKSNLEEGLEETFPGSDPVSATRQPEEDAPRPVKH